MTPAAVLLSYRLGGTDGVSVETEKWRAALETLGFATRRVAGELADGAGPTDTVLPWLAWESRDPPIPSELAGALAGADLVVVENLCSLPLNIAAARTAAAVLGDCPELRVVFHHHDLPWQRARFAAVTDLPPARPGSLHVTINDLSRRELAGRAISAHTIRNVFDVDVPAGARTETRASLGFGADDLVVLQPTRAIPRKNVPAGIEFAAALGRHVRRRVVRYWLTGPAEEGYGPALAGLLAGAPVPVTVGRVPEVADAYAASDVVVFPSTWEGFGNPVIESVIARRPIATARYPVLDELVDLGLALFSIDAPDLLVRWLAAPDEAQLRANLALVRRHFAAADLPARLESAFAGMGWSRW
ncbi:MAG TPA: glycosyltransferase [Acidimicrobiia bacterium]